MRRDLCICGLASCKSHNTFVLHRLTLWPRIPLVSAEDMAPKAEKGSIRAPTSRVGATLEVKHLILCKANIVLVVTSTLCYTKRTVTYCARF